VTVANTTVGRLPSGFDAAGEVVILVEQFYRRALGAQAARLQRPGSSKLRSKRRNPEDWSRCIGRYNLAVRSSYGVQTQTMKVDNFGLRRRTAVALMLLAIAGTAQAQVSYRGAGVAPCGLWVETRRSGGEAATIAGLQQMESWILGYLSAVANRSSRDILKDHDAAFIFGWLDGYCKANVLDKAVGHGVEVLSRELEQRTPSK
jgi:hypothetical protein